MNDVLEIIGGSMLMIVGVSIAAGVGVVCMLGIIILPIHFIRKYHNTSHIEHTKYQSVEAPVKFIAYEDENSELVSAIDSNDVVLV